MLNRLPVGSAENVLRMTESRLSQYTNTLLLRSLSERATLVARALSCAGICAGPHQSSNDKFAVFDEPQPKPTKPTVQSNKGSM